MKATSIKFYTPRMESKLFLACTQDLQREKENSLVSEQKYKTLPISISKNYTILIRQKTVASVLISVFLFVCLFVYLFVCPNGAALTLSALPGMVDESDGHL